MHTLVRYGYVPFMLVAVNGAAVALLAAGAPRYRLLALLAVAVGASFAAERVLPYHAPWNDSHDDTARDIVHAVVNETLTLAGLALIPAAAAIVPFDSVWPTGWPLPAQLAVAVIVADLGITLTHYASHRFPVLWRLHAVHHSVTRAYGFNGLMKHPLHQSLETLVGVTPLLLLGMPVQVATALAFTVVVQLLLQHSNVDYRVGPLSGVLALNRAHRFHHLKWAGVGDVNFGLFTLLWDHALRTYSYDPTRRFTSADLGMAAEPDYPTGYLAQLAAPFRRSTSAR